MYFICDWNRKNNGNKNNKSNSNYIRVTFIILVTFFNNHCVCDCIRKINGYKNMFQLIFNISIHNLSGSHGNEKSFTEHWASIGLRVSTCDMDSCTSFCLCFSHCPTFFTLSCNWQLQVEPFCFIHDPSAKGVSGHCKGQCECLQSSIQHYVMLYKLITMEPWHVAMVTAGWEDPSAGGASRRGPGQGRVSGGVPGSGAPRHHHLHGNNQRRVSMKKIIIKSK